MAHHEKDSDWAKFPEHIQVIADQWNGKTTGHVIATPTHEGQLVAEYVLNNVKRVKFVYEDAE